MLVSGRHSFEHLAKEAITWLYFILPTFLNAISFIMDSQFYQCQNQSYEAAGAPGFLKLFLCGRLYAYVCVFVCVSAPEAINN